jgi:hypothetical protein
MIGSTLLLTGCAVQPFSPDHHHPAHPEAPAAAGRPPSGALATEAVAPSPASQPADDAPEGASHYTCPMHPEVVREEPGSCPICGMDLVPPDPAPEKEVRHEQHNH